MGACNSVVWFGGGESQRSKPISSSGYSEKAHCTGKPTETQSYLGPISGSLHVPIEGVYRITEKTEDKVAIRRKTAQNHDENTARTYLEPIRNGMQKPIEGRSCPLPQQSRATNGSNVQPIYKGAKDKTEHNRTANSFSTQKHTQHPQKLLSIAPLNSRFRFSFHKLIISKIG